MGANYDSRTITAKSKSEVQRKFQAAVEDARYESGFGGYTGTIAENSGGLSFPARTFRSPRKAHEFIEDKHQKWQPALAVRCGKGKWIVGGWFSS